MSKINISGIYAIRNKINGKLYIGSSNSVHYRWKQQHRPRLCNNTHYNKHLQHAWNKYGENAFELQIIEECAESLLAGREGYWIEHHKSWDRQHGYNLNRIVDNKVILSEETKEAMKRNMIKEWEIIKENNYQGKDLGFIEFKLTPEKKEEITKLRAEGLAWEEIFKTIGISRTQFYRAMKINDGQYGGNSKKRATYKTMTPEIKKKAIELREQGKTWKEIGEELGVARTTFYRHKMEVDHRNMVRKAVTEADTLQAKLLHQEGKSWRAINKQLGFSNTTLQRYFNENKKTQKQK